MVAKWQSKRLVYDDALKGLFAVPLAGKPKRSGASTDSSDPVSIDARGDRVAFGSPGCSTCNLPITVLSVPKGTLVGRIGGPKSYNFFPSLSPDGKQVVFVQTTPTTHGIVVAKVDGSNLRPLKQCGGEPPGRPPPTRSPARGTDRWPQRSFSSRPGPALLPH